MLTIPTCDETPLRLVNQALPPSIAGQATSVLPPPRSCMRPTLCAGNPQLAADPATLAPSFLAYIGHPAYGLDALRADLDRFTFLLGGNDGEFLLGEDPAVPPPARPRSKLTNKNHRSSRQVRSELANNRGQNSRTKPRHRRQAGHTRLSPATPSRQWPDSAVSHRPVVKCPARGH